MRLHDAYLWSLVSIKKDTFFNAKNTATKQRVVY